MYNILTNMKILDLTRLLPGGYMTQLLADLGATVVKVEDPWNGDYIRWMDPKVDGYSAGFLALNRNKKSIKLNLKSPDGKEVFKRIIKDYEIIIEGFRPGVMKNLGLGYEELKEINPGIILCSISGYGQDGPYANRPGHDLNYTAVAGSLGLTGLKDGPPVMPGVQIADIGGGALIAAVAILAAYNNRCLTGKGQFIDISMLDGVLSWLPTTIIEYFNDNHSTGRGSMRLNGGAICYNIYKTKDNRYISLGCLEEKFWVNFCNAIGQKDMISEQFSRDDNQYTKLSEIFKSETLEEWNRLLLGLDVCYEPVLSIKEVLKHPQIVHRTLTRELSAENKPTARVTRNPIKLPFENEVRDQYPPEYGEHTREILASVGYSEEEIDKLIDAIS